MGHGHFEMLELPGSYASRRACKLMVQVLEQNPNLSHLMIKCEAVDGRYDRRLSNMLADAMPACCLNLQSLELNMRTRDMLASTIPAIAQAQRNSPGGLKLKELHLTEAAEEGLKKVRASEEALVCKALRGLAGLTKLRISCRLLSKSIGVYENLPDSLQDFHAQDMSAESALALAAALMRPACRIENLSLRFHDPAQLAKLADALCHPNCSVRVLDVLVKGVMSQAEDAFGQMVARSRNLRFVRMQGTSSFWRPKEFVDQFQCRQGLLRGVECYTLPSRHFNGLVQDVKSATQDYRRLALQLMRGNHERSMLHKALSAQQRASVISMALATHLVGLDMQVSEEEEDREAGMLRGIADLKPDMDLHRTLVRTLLAGTNN